eukprot:1159476-Pelagomonas_calceolata.AAC.2
MNSGGAFSTPLTNPWSRIDYWLTLLALLAALIIAVFQPLDVSELLLQQQRNSLLQPSFCRVLCSQKQVSHVDGGKICQAPLILKSCRTGGPIHAGSLKRRARGVGWGGAGSLPQLGQRVWLSASKAKSLLAWLAWLGQL